MGKVQTSSRGSTKQAERWTWTGVCVGAGQKETQTAQGHRRSTKEIRASVRIAGSRWRQPRAQGLQTSAKAVLPQTSSGTRHPGGIRESGQCNDARIMHTLSDDKKDGYEIGILSLYPHRPEKEHSRNDFLSRGLPHQQAANEESTLLKGKSSINKVRECNELLIKEKKICPSPCLYIAQERGICKFISKA